MNKKFKLNSEKLNLKNLKLKIKEVSADINYKDVLKFVGKTALTLFLVFVLTACIVAASLTIYILRFVDTEANLNIDKESLDYTSIVYSVDKNGEYVESERIWAGENRIWVDLDKIPKNMQNAIIAVEDKDFDSHDGVDWVRTAGAFANMFLKFYKTEFGASTITQQLVKNLTGENQHRIDRKVKEIFIALNLEKKYSKHEILEAYLNVIPLDQNLNGVQAASKAYFNKDVSELTLAECASLAAITQHPTKYGPYRSEEKNKERRDMILGMMYDQGMITKEECENARNEVIKFSREEFRAEVNNYQSYYVDQVIEDVINDLVETKGYTKSYAREVVYLRGVKIYTPMEIEMQERLEEQFETQAAFPKVSGAVSPQSAMVILGLDGKVQAMVGGLGEKSGDRIFNRATAAYRQPGSTMKPISIYGLAIEKGLINWSTIMTDKKITLSDGTVFSNHYNRYMGNMPIEYALQRSTNTIPVQICQTLTPKESFNFLTNKLGITSLVSSKKINGQIHSDINISPMSLGGVTVGISPLELTAAYQIFANGGIYNKPITYIKVEDFEGNVLLENKSDPQRVISEETAVIMNKMLQQVCVGKYGTGTAAKLSNMPTAGKTGTTNDKKDIWFVGLTPYNVSAIWYGYDTPKNLSGISVSTPRLWKNIMSKVMAGYSSKDFITSENVLECSYCVESGMLATSGCTNLGTGYYTSDNLPENCTVHGAGSAPETTPTENEEAKTE